MKIEYINRYNNSIFFEEKAEGILMSGEGEALKWCRFGYVNTPSDKELTMVDPSGGPYIGEDMDMGHIDANFKGKKVKHIESVPEGYLIVIKED
jgi:hypothetical protein